MDKLSEKINKLKQPANFNEFVSSVDYIIDFYYHNDLRKIDGNNKDVLTQHEINKILQQLSENESMEIETNSNNGANDELLEQFIKETVVDSVPEQRLNFKKMTIDLKDISYNKNRDIIESYLQLIMNGANLYKASFDMVGKKVILEIADYCKRKIWLVTFSVGSREECTLVKNALIEARAQRREKMMALLTCKSAYPDDDGVVLPEGVKIEYKLSGIISQSAYDSIDDFFHWNKIGSMVESFYVRNLALEAHTGEVRYDKNENALYITDFNYFYDLHIEEVRLPIKSVDEIAMLGGVLKNLDTYRDSNLYFIQTQKIPDEHDENFDDFDFSNFDPADYGFKYFRD